MMRQGNAEANDNYKRLGQVAVLRRPNRPRNILRTFYSLQANRELTIRETVQALDITHMTLHLWRAGTPTLAPLPCGYKQWGRQRWRVVISEDQLIQWLTENRPHMVSKWKRRALA